MHTPRKRKQEPELELDLDALFDDLDASVLNDTSSSSAGSAHKTPTKTKRRKTLGDVTTTPSNLRKPVNDIDALCEGSDDLEKTFARRGARHSVPSVKQRVSYHGFWISCTYANTDS